jgi:hypothetical protein
MLEDVSSLRVGQVVVVTRVRRGMMAVARQVWLSGLMAAGVARRLRKPLLVAACVGTALALACYLAGPAVSSLVNGVAGFLGALVAGALGRLRRVLRQAAAQGWGVHRIP